MSLYDTCINLLEMVEAQEEVIRKQNETISNLVNENVEKDNLIGELFQLPY